MRTVLLYDLALELLGAPPFPDALEAVTVAAVGEDAETAFAGIGFLEHHLHAHATHHIFTTLDGKRDFHVLLVSLNAGLPLTNDLRFYSVTFRKWKESENRISTPNSP